MSAAQLALPFPARVALGREDFLVTAANEIALAQVEAWTDWPLGRLLLVGPPASGKSHLAAVWASQAGATITDAAALAGSDLRALASAPLAVEDADRVAGDRAAETALFHLHNLAADAGQPLLLTARLPARDWGLDLPDLASRMAAIPIARVAPPDDALLAALLVKLFSDRQIAASPRLVEYCLRRMERSFAAAQRLVADLDARSLAEGRRVGTALAGEILDKSTKLL